MVGVPSSITEVEKRAIREAVERQCREVKLIDEAMAAAIGCNLPVTEATASLIVDIGGGTTDIAVISLKDIVYALSVREGGDAMDEAIINHLRRRHHLLIGEATASSLRKPWAAHTQIMTGRRWRCGEEVSLAALLDLSLSQVMKFAKQ